MLGSKYWRAASVLVAGSMVLAACGNATPQVVKETVVVNQTSIATVEVTKEVEVTAAPEATPEPTAVPEAQQTDTVVVGQQQEPSTLHPNIAAESAKTYILAPVFVGCMGQDNSQPPQWIPLGCEQVPTIENGGAALVGEGADQHLEVTYTIKSGWRWTDGQPVKASDVVYTWKLLMDPDFEIADRSALEKVYDVSAVNDSTVLVKAMSEAQAKQAAAGTLTGNVAFDKLKDDYVAQAYDKQNGPVVDPVYWFALFPGWLPEHILSSIPAKDQAASDFAKKPVGDGPYVVTDWKEGQEIDLDASDQPFPLGEPKIKHIIFRFISGGAGPVIAALQNGEVDIVPGNVGGLSTSNAPDIESVVSGGLYNVLWNTGYSWEHIDINVEKAPLNDVKVRQAMFYAIDKKSIIDALYNGKNEAIDLPGPTTAQNSWGYTDNYTKYTYDPDKAKALLQEDGWDCSSTPCTKKDASGNTVKLSFSLQTTTRSDRIQLAQVIQRQWAAVGIDANLQFLESRNFFAAASAGGPLNSGSYNTGIYTWSGSDDPQFYGLYGCSNIPSKENNWSGQNTPRWCNQEASDALKQSEQTITALSRDERKPLIEKFFQAFSNDVPVIPLHAATEPYVYRTGLKNFKPGLTQYSVFSWNAWEWELSK
jgi:peptide/nickel transport system substrate-binding protein